MFDFLRIIHHILMYNQQYKKILEELYQSFITRFKNPHLSDELEQKAIDKMKHFGWIAEELSEKRYEIDVSLPSINKIQDEKSMLITINKKK
ncbi:MAG: hypothetical protein ACP5KF_06285 [Sulfurihydrogenibium sp.]